MASSKREKELARQRAERQAARRAAAAKRKRQRQAVIASVVAILLVVGAAAFGAVILTGGDDGPDNIAAEQPSAAPAASTAPSAPAGEVTCTYEKPEGAKAAREVELPPPTGVETQAVFDVTITTNRGTVVFETLTSKAPCTVQNLRSLAHFAYFDDTPCHRLTTAGIQVLQCGDPSGTGTGGPGYTFADENLEGAKYPRGTVAMANSGPNTNGSQFFLVYEDSQLPPNYTPFGTITQGLDVLEKVAAAGSDEANGPGSGDGKPKLPVQIKTLRVKPQKA